MPFINGTYFITPSAIVQTNDDNLQSSTGQTSLSLILIGSSTDGQPNTALTINGPQDAINQLKGGDGLQACMLAFNPSNEVQGASSLTFIRVDPATQATSAIGTTVNLATASYGTPANLAKWMVTPGTLSGYKVSLGQDFVGPGGQLYPTVSQDNTGLNVLSIYYTGVGTVPTYTVSDTSLVLAATGGTGLTVTFTSTMTVQQVVNQINNTTGWGATVLDPNASDLVSSLFDYVSVATAVGTTALTAKTLTANVTAVVRYINTSSYFTAVRQANPATITASSSWTYATGGTTPAATNTNWQSAYTVAQQAALLPGVTQCVSSATSNWAMNDAHCALMTANGIKRIGYVGDALGATLETEITNVLALNSQYTTLVWPGNKGIDYNGNATTFAPYLVAAQIAGARVGTPPPGKLTNVSIISSGVETVLTTGSGGTLAQANAAGIAAIYPTTLGTTALSWDRTTWMQDTKYDKVENLTSLAAGMMVFTQRAILKIGTGVPLTPGLLGQKKSALWADLMNWKQYGLISISPALADITLIASGQFVTGSANIYIIVPGNYWFYTLNLNAYSGTV